MVEARIKLSPPWAIHISQLKALFGPDPDIEINYDNDNYRVKMYVADEAKAEALQRILQTDAYFGNIYLEVIIIPPNKTVDEVLEQMATKEKLFQLPPVTEDVFNTAFNKNPVYAFSKTIEGLFGNRLIYVVFKNKVVQFFADNLNDLFGNISTLYEDIADAVLDMDNLNGVFLCTDIEEKVGKPLGEWP